MKTFCVDKNSWHYKMNAAMVKTDPKLARDGKNEIYVQSKDNICSYWQLTILSMFKIAFASFLLLFIATGFIYAMWTAARLFMINPYESLRALGLLLTFTAAIAAFIFISNWMARKREIKIDNILHNGETETSLAKAKYFSWKNKVCSKVEFK
jgi:hypothetical protein